MEIHHFCPEIWSDQEPEDPGRGVQLTVSRVESYKTQLGTTPENVTVLLPALHCPQN